MATNISVFAKRLHEARLRVGLSQKALGIAAKIDAFSASPRMNQYERGIHLPDMKTVERLAKVLGVTPAYFFAKDDDLAELLAQWEGLSALQKTKILHLVKK